MPVRTVHKISCNILHCYPYKITHVRKLLLVDLLVRYTFAAQFMLAWKWAMNGHGTFCGQAKLISTKLYK